MVQRNITPENINKIMQSMLNDPKSMQIWAEIIIGNQDDTSTRLNFTAKELHSRLDIGKSVLYTRLNNLVQKGVIETQLIVKDTKKKKRVPEQTYKINTHFNKLYNDLISDHANQIQHIRDYRLFHLYVINSILMREIRILSEQTNEEVAKSVNPDHYYGKMGTLSEEEHDFMQNELFKIHKALSDQFKKAEINENKKEEEDYLSFKKEYFYYSGFLKIK